MAEQTKGRLLASGPELVIEDRETKHVATCWNHNEIDPDESEANAVRLTAAWNAVQSIPTAALESGVIADLIEALKDIRQCTDPNSTEENYRADDTEGCLDTAFAIADRILAKLETPCPSTPTT